MASDALPSVAIAGGTGHFGSYVVRAFASPQSRPLFSSITILVRSPPAADSELAKLAASANLTLLETTPENLSTLDPHVLISTLPVSAPLSTQLVQVLGAKLDRKLTLYIPSEFGVDHTAPAYSVSNIPVPEPTWAAKQEHFRDAYSQPGPPKKVVRVFNGLFMEDSVGPWYGFDTKKGVYRCLASGDVKVSYTSLEDVARVVVRVSSLALVKEELAKVPDKLHVAGCSYSVREIAAIMGEVSGKTIEVVEEDLEAAKAKVMAKGGDADMAEYLQSLMGEGAVWHSEEGENGLLCENEMVNPGERFWRWKDMKNYAEEVAGKPWADAVWQVE